MRTSEHDENSHVRIFSVKNEATIFSRHQQGSLLRVWLIQDEGRISQHSDKGL